MKKIFLKNFIFLLLTTLILSFIGAKPFESDYLDKKSFWALDNDSKYELPINFRDIPLLNISGSGQFTTSQIENLKNKINKPNICIVDLRQESHGFIDDLAVCYYNIYKIPNNGYTTEESLKKEKSDLNKIKLDNQLNIFHKPGTIFKEITPTFICNEENPVNEAGMEYKRFSVVDNGIPSPTVVDNFVEFILNKPNDLHLHFHCDAGEGRTTTFMTMYQIMNCPNLTLEQILTYQYNIGGIILTNNKTRSDFLKEFFNYISSVRDCNYETKYSQWLLNN